MRKNVGSALLITMALASSSFASDDFTTWQEMRFKNVVKQQYDFSCGVAAITTLFNFQFGRKANEQQILLDYIKKQPKNYQDEITEKGLSLFDLKKIGEKANFNTAVVTIPLSGLVKSKRPALVYIEDENYKHFVVFRGISQGKVFLADPSLGNRSLLIEEFLYIWKGKRALFIDSTKEKKKSYLDITEEESLFLQYETTQNILNKNIIKVPFIRIN